MSERIQVRPMGEREYAVVLTEGIDTTHHRVVVPEELLDELALDEDDADRLVEEAMAFLLEREHADAVPADLVLSSLIEDYEDFLPEMRTRLDIPFPG